MERQFVVPFYCFDCFWGVVVHNGYSYGITVIWGCWYTMDILMLLRVLVHKGNWLCEKLPIATT